MLIKKKKLIFLILLTICLSAYGKSYKALPSVVIEQKNGIIEKFEDNIFGNLTSDCKCIIEIKDDLLFIYFTDDKESSNREDNEIKPESFSITFKKSNFEGRFHISGYNQKGKIVDGYIDEINKNGSLCIYDNNEIDLYMIFEYAISL